MSEQDALLHEYNQLREELRLHLRPRSNYVLVLMAISAAVGLSTAAEAPLPLLLMSLLPIFLIEEHTGRLNAMYRIATYIALQIEPKYKLLNWETLGPRFLGRASPRARLGFDLDTLVMLLLITIQVVLAWFLWSHQQRQVLTEGQMVVASSVLLVLWAKTVARRAQSVKNREGGYEEQWKKQLTRTALDSSGDESGVHQVSPID